MEISCLNFKVSLWSLIIADFFYSSTREDKYWDIKFCSDESLDRWWNLLLKMRVIFSRLILHCTGTVYFYSAAFYRNTVDTRVLFLFSLSFSRDITPRLDGGGNVTWNYASSFPWVSERIAGVIVVSRYFDEIELPSTTNR